MTAPATMFVPASRSNPLSRVYNIKGINNIKI